MENEKTANREISDLKEPVRKMSLQLGIDINKSDFFRSRGIRGKIIETKRTLDRQCYLWGKGRQAFEFARINLGSREKFAKPKENKVSWLDDPRYSNHYHSIAIDMVLVQKGLMGQIKEFIWSRFFNGENIYEKMGELATVHGFRSFEESYKSDSYHCELPIVAQGKGNNCYCFAIINAIQKVSLEWRKKNKYQMIQKALKLEEIWKKNRDQGILNRNFSRQEQTLEIAKNLGYIKNWQTEKFNFENLDNWRNLENQAIVVNQGYSNESDYDLMSSGRGIKNHAYGFHSVGSEQQLFMLNSHATNPFFEVKITDKISKVYSLEV